MKKGVLILVLGLIAAAAYGCIYYLCTSPARDMQQSAKPELAWLKDEFNLSGAEFTRITELHEATCRDARKCAAGSTPKSND